MRTDGRRPTLQCLTDCYMAMFGEAARCIQNTSTTLELWLKNKGNWQHYWKESIVSFDQVGSERASASIPAVLTQDQKMNDKLFKSFQGAVDRRFNTVSRQIAAFKKHDGGGGGGGGGGKSSAEKKKLKKQRQQQEAANTGGGGGFHQGGNDNATGKGKAKGNGVQQQHQGGNQVPSGMQSWNNRKRK